jgi:hypothetical protein
VKEEGGIGLLPTLETVAGKVIDELSEDDMVDQFVRDVKGMATIPREVAGKAGFRDAVTQGTRIWTDTKRHLTTTTTPTNPQHQNVDPFNTTDTANMAGARPAIRTFFSSYNIDNRLRALTYYSVTVRNDRAVLDRSRFIGNLENYIFGDTGVSIDIDRLGTDVGYARVLTIDLGMVNAITQMYTKMRENTDRHLPTVPGTPLTFDAAAWRRVREALRGGSYDAAQWDNNNYRLSDALIREMRELLSAVGTGSISNWNDYKQTTLSAASRFGGLRVGTHGQLTGEPTGNVELEGQPGAAGSGALIREARAGRQSHHIPQFLLVEYFRNDATTKIERRVGASTQMLPGFVMNGGRGDSFNDGAGHTINLQRLDPSSGRGDGLPAISLAARTHQRGRLHIISAFDWSIPQGTERDPISIELRGTETQGRRIDRIFYQFLHHRMSYSGSDTDAPGMIQQAHGNAPHHKPHVYQAMKDTYRWMYNTMITVLPHAIKNNELDYYQIVAKGMPGTLEPDGDLKPEYRPHGSDVAAVVNAIERKNSTIMAQWK